jgi:hypothetical protein
MLALLQDLPPSALTTAPALAVGSAVPPTATQWIPTQEMPNRKLNPDGSGSEERDRPHAGAALRTAISAPTRRPWDKRRAVLPRMLSSGIVALLVGGVVLVWRFFSATQAAALVRDPVIASV